MTDLAGTAERGRMQQGKSATAFRTISEVSTELEVPQHVLRFWETKFPQIRPLKRGGGRRYYRPDDVELLRRIQHLLYREGYTIRGVQRLLKENKGQLPAAGDVIPPDTSGPDEPQDLFQDQPGDACMDGGRQRPAPDEGGPEQAGPENVEMGLSPARRDALGAILDELLAIRALLP